MKLTVVIPCYNEANTIVDLVKAVRAAPFPDKPLAQLVELAHG